MDNNHIDASLSDNKTAFAKHCKIPLERWVFANQTHGKNVALVDETTPQNHKFEDTDAMICKAENRALFIKMADCQAILVFDPSKNAIAAVHNGWRGSAQNIITETLQAMTSEFDTNPADILVGISAAIGPCCAYFTDPYKELPAALHKHILADNHYVDFFEASLKQLADAGVKAENIECEKICSACGDEYFSHRREKEKAGRMGALIMLGST